MIFRDSIIKLVSSLKARFTKTDDATIKDLSSSKIKQRQALMLILVIALAITSFFLISYLLNNFGASYEAIERPSIAKNNINIEVADEALKSEKLWVNFFEDKLDSAKESLEQKIVSAEDSIKKTEHHLEEKTASTIAEMTEQLRLAKEELESAMAEIRAFREEQNADYSKNNQLPSIAEISSYQLDNTEVFSITRSTKDYIPEGTYLDSILLTGISVSTSLASRENPVPVTFRVTGRGNLSRDFKIDVRTCEVTGSTYGDLSSERAVIRLESMTCLAQKTGEITTTKIAGIAYGDDGFNHIKGDIIQTSDKFARNAMLGGILSGFSQNMKGIDSFAITGLGQLAANKKTGGDMLKSSASSGVSSAAEKIADYYLKQAESMSPILQVPGGVKVNLLFTKGVLFGTTDIKDKVANARRKNGDN